TPPGGSLRRASSSFFRLVDAAPVPRLFLRPLEIDPNHCLARGKNSMRRLVLLCAVLLSTAAPISAVRAAETHPFSVQDMIAMDRISEPQVSPDGRRIAFVVSALDLPANKRRTDIYMVNTDGSGMRRLTTHEAADTSPRWAPDGRTLYFLSTRS